VGETGSHLCETGSADLECRLQELGKNQDCYGGAEYQTDVILDASISLGLRLHRYRRDP
jgi:hypothetical protein